MATYNVSTQYKAKGSPWQQVTSARLKQLASMWRLRFPFLLCAADSPTVRCFCICTTSLTLRSFSCEKVQWTLGTFNLLHMNYLLASAGLDDPTILPFFYNTAPPWTVLLSIISPVSPFFSPALLLLSFTAPISTSVLLTDLPPN